MDPDAKRKPRTFHATDQEYEAIGKEATKQGMSIAEYIRLKTIPKPHHKNPDK